MLEVLKNFEIKKEKQISIHGGTGGGTGTGTGDEDLDDNKEKKDYCPDWYPSYLC